MSKNGKDWGKLIVAKGSKKLPKKFAQSGHTGRKLSREPLSLNGTDKRRLKTTSLGGGDQPKLVLNNDSMKKTKINYKEAGNVQL